MQTMQDKQRPAQSPPVPDLRVQVSVTLAEKRFSLEQLLELHPGSLLEFPRGPDQPLELQVDGSEVGQGRAVDIGEKLGFLLEEVTAAPRPATRGLKS
jgi:flagellar motor switch/type III secretory pathway protein FliN